MRILHLAYEDPRRPGSGGGSVRTLEVDRRLAERHEVTAVVAAYPGARERVEDGIRWVPIGPRTASGASRLAWFALAGIEARRRRADVVLEDFGAPFSTALSPLFTSRPVVASVQWLFAREMRAKYHLPFDAVEAAGLRAYDDFIAVSDWLADELRRRRPGALVEAIPNGVDARAFDVPVQPAEHLLFLGRLDRDQKGLDLLVDIAAAAARELGDAMPPVLVAGDGPDGPAAQGAVAARGLGDLVRFVGRVEGDRKADLLARSHAVLMPSRFETFGMVAVEAEAAGVPVITFDVGPLRAVAGEAGILVAPFDTASFAREAARVVREPARRDALGSAGRDWARQYDWDTIAERVETHLADAVGRARVGRGQPAPRTATPPTTGTPQPGRDPGRTSDGAPVVVAR
ncbi:MAG TPA: glycosyltransferase family 4 protein [Candidatus Limnocylindrales bacterium]|nr:glycosyltransferase family 4 protein [Candidatus Limnocylindrales bacterium]